MTLRVAPPAVARSCFSAANLPERPQLFWGEQGEFGTRRGVGAVHLGVEKEQELMAQRADAGSASSSCTGTGLGTCQAAGFKREAKANSGNFVPLHFVLAILLCFFWVEILLLSSDVADCSALVSRRTKPGKHLWLLGQIYFLVDFL